jgi:hypothetical protein
MAQTSNYANKDSLGNVVETNYCGGKKLLWWKQIIAFMFD